MEGQGRQWVPPSPRCPFTVCSPPDFVLSNRFFIPKTALFPAPCSWLCPAKRTLKSRLNGIVFTVSQPEKPAEANTMFADQVRSKVTL